jgi:hypothetical protein
MGEKPPDIIGRGSKASIKQAPTAISFPPSQQFPEEFLVSGLLLQSSTTFTLIVVIFCTHSTLANNFALPIHSHTTHPHWNPTTTISAFTTMNTTMLISIHTTDSTNIDPMINSTACPVNIISFTSATIATATPTTG